MKVFCNFAGSYKIALPLLRVRRGAGVLFCDFVTLQKRKVTSKVTTRKPVKSRLSGLFFVFCDFVTLFFIKYYKNYMYIYEEKFKKKSHKVTNLFSHVKKPDLSAFFFLVTL